MRLEKVDDSNALAQRRYDEPMWYHINRRPELHAPTQCTNNMQSHDVAIHQPSGQDNIYEEIAHDKTRQCPGRWIRSPPEENDESTAQKRDAAVPYSAVQIPTNKPDDPCPHQNQHYQNTAAMRRKDLPPGYVEK